MKDKYRLLREEADRRFAADQRIAALRGVKVQGDARRNGEEVKPERKDVRKDRRARAGYDFSLFWQLQNNVNGR